MTRTLRPMRTSHRLFLVTLLAKGVLGVVQVTTAAAIYSGVLQHLPRFAQWLVQQELSEDPTDFLATRFLAWANVSPASDISFYTIYFSAHGVLHIAIVAALIWGARWAYNAAVVVLAAFVFYQIFEWFSVGGIMLLLLSAIDLAVIYLTIRENRNRASRI